MLNITEQYNVKLTENWASHASELAFVFGND